MDYKKNEIVLIAGGGNSRKTGVALSSIITSVMSKGCANEGPLNQVVIISPFSDSTTMLMYMAFIGGFANHEEMERAFARRNCEIDVIHPIALDANWVLDRLDEYVKGQVGGSLDILIDDFSCLCNFDQYTKDRLKEIGKACNGDIYITYHAATPITFNPIHPGSERCFGIHRDYVQDIADVILVTPSSSSEVTAKIYKHSDVSQIDREFTFKPSGITENSDELKALNNPGYEWVREPLAD